MDLLESVEAMQNSRVTVEGDVSSKGTGLEAFFDSVVTVNGNVDGDILTVDGTVNVGGTVNGNNGSTDSLKDQRHGAIVENGKSTITVKGDVNAPQNGIRTDGGKDTVITIEGTLNVTGGTPIILDHSSYDSNNIDAATIVVYAIKGNLQNIVRSGRTVYEANPSIDLAGMPGNEIIVVEKFEEDSDPKFVDNQIRNINYIIKTENSSKGAISKLEGTVRKAGYDTATENTIISVTVKEGYDLSAGKIKVTKNADGTYTLTVPRGGGVTLSAELIARAIKEADKGNDEDDKKSSDSIQPVSSPVFAAAVLNGNVLTATVDPSVSGDAQYSAKIRSMIADVPQDGTVVLNITNGAFLDASIVNALIARPDVNMTLIVNFMGMPFALRIPAGYELLPLMGPDGRIDFATLLMVFGATPSN